MSDDTKPQAAAAMSPASAGSQWLAFVANAARLVALVSCLATAEVRWNAANWGTHWCVAWVNVSGVTQVEVYVPPKGMAIVRLNWMQ